MRFLLIGHGALYDEVLAEVRRLGIEENFVFAGLIDRERIPDMISAMDVVAHTALWEGLPRVLPQAMAMGKPCVSFDVDGTSEVLIDGKTGYLVKTHDSAALAEAISNLLDDKALREEMGANGRRHVDPNFRAEKMVADISDVYQVLIERFPKRLEAFGR